MTERRYRDADAETFLFTIGGDAYIASVRRYEDGDIADIFLTAGNDIIAHAYAAAYGGAQAFRVHVGDDFDETIDALICAARCAEGGGPHNACLFLLLSEIEEKVKIEEEAKRARRRLQ